ncbi:MAG: helix-turn-helix domain-containing protein [Lachnospiraceae bacterium]|nr:helix-turn-helix domain-containing protein [Lachnospiraceae bacterium]
MSQKTRTVALSKNAAEPDDKLMVKPFIQADITAHDHDCFELAYVTGGTAVQTLNGVSEIVYKGDYFIIDYGSEHSYQNTRNFTLINCLFLSEIIDDTMAGCRSFDELLRVCLIRYRRQYLGKTPVNRIFHDEDGRILNLLQGMQEEYLAKNTGYREIFRGRLLEILILTMRKVVEEHDSGNDQSNRSDMVQEAIKYLEIHYSDKAVLGSFCSKHHYSQQYVSRRFKQETGLTALEYLQKIRIEKCCELLAGSELSVQEIAHSVGYEDAKFFQQVFRRMLRMSPREYRRMALSGRT